MKDRREETSPLDEIKFKAPFTGTISGPSGSGKSSFCIRLLQILKSLCTESRFDGGITWCYSEKTAVPSLKNVRYHEGVPENFDNGTADRA
jgi:uridine kinase